MSSRITAFEAKTRLGRVLDRVKSGEEITITRHGEPVALMVPIAAPDADAVERALDTFKRIRSDLRRRGVKITRRDIRRWAAEGRR